MKAAGFIAFCLSVSFSAHSQRDQSNDVVIARGHMPDITKDRSNAIAVVYGSGDSIMYTSSGDGQSFTTPSLVAVLPNLFASAMRGPQIAATPDGLIITACTGNGNIYAYKQEAAGKWTKAIKVNDAGETAKEALMDLGADGLHAFAVWLSVKSPKGQNVYGAASADGGKTWGKNVLVYASPDSTVCECCKPSAVMKDNKVYVMFRNWLKGSRDLYITQSTDGGATFKKAKKLGRGSWKLNACPMDGGGLAVDNKGEIQTVWRREGAIYAATPGAPEKMIGEGKGCTLETVDGKNIYAWVENGEITIINTQASKKIVPGKGSGPVLKALNTKEVICIWEDENVLHSSVIEL